MIDRDRLLEACETARADLLAQRDASGHWVGELSSSALSTATATSALAVVVREAADSQSMGCPSAKLRQLIAGGLQHLARSQNADGGWGDTDKSLSNIATTMLARAAFHLADAAQGHGDLLGRAEGYIDRQGGVPGLRRRYGKDKTFAVPILANCALAGLVRWDEVSPLPFELACLPRAVLRFARLPVVSYAIPALVAIGQARYFHRKPSNPITRLVRRLAVGGSLKTLGRMQPASGGYLEAAPLTSFVVMGLAGTGRGDHPVVRRGVEFLVASVRPDGSWPIDTNLATWTTTLAINALATCAQGKGGQAAHGTRQFSFEETPGCLDWLLECQHRQVHPFTDAAPGGWGWTDLSGAVPDADDTSGALLALAALRKSSWEADFRRIDAAAVAGVRWLLELQNTDGGWPTFCRGWGKLPFDRSGTDLTAHAVRALSVWRQLPAARTVTELASRIDAAVRRGLEFLARRQRPDGSWVPLWFGNQHRRGEENPVYGTARVLLAYRDLRLLDSGPARRGLGWLAANSNSDGGWGSGPAGRSDSRAEEVSSVEETAVATEAMISAENDPSLQPLAIKGLRWLVEAVRSGRHRETAPIGFYFAKLWYHERLYPLVFTVSTLGQATRRWCGTHGPSPAASCERKT